MKNSVYTLLQAFLKREKYRINSDELQFQLLSHPSYPSLHSITGVLHHFNIEGIALELPCDVDILAQLPDNFIALSKEEQYMLVKKTDDKFNLVLEDGKKYNLTDEEFLATWDGVLLGIESPDMEEEKNITIGRIPNYILLLTVLLLLTASFIYAGPTTFMMAHFILGVIGLGISILILKHELGYNSKALDKICNASKMTSCDAVLQSKGARILGLLKLSDLSIVYFSGITIAWFLNPVLEIGSTTMVMMTILSLPATIYSLYYQYYGVKKWCPLCLAIVGVLWMQAISIVLNRDLFNFHVNGFAVLSFCLLMASSIWMPVRSLLLDNQSLKKIKIDHYRFKRNFDVFTFLLNGSKGMDTTIPKRGEKEEIVMGDKDSPLELLLLTNPECFYCKSAHLDMEEITNKYPNGIRLVIRFNVNAKNLDQIGPSVCCRLLELYNEDHLNVLIEALGEAYSENANLESWLKKWGEPKDIQTYGQILMQQQEWCFENSIHFTPALLINGKEYPSEYKREDLLFFMEDLMELTENRSVKEMEFVQTN
ncbi:vitamin K epoxide reductase family protein [Flagellimonas pelagia]|uniref:Vitamin K epoxide reductase domain-containing protein n=1 Tax=Flagellimonas pelagia TaxID=2306998 RepID=A0A3A1NDY9_9FLAO|nr:vitamin K epoxide reductase family protein [Allomuricauda maritima]RIV42252.1 hypothetical protein D2V05_19400 [Allomuricauda maritima]TXJ91140.1 hypothetical protein FQ017_19240 [Allomuricauda maritima]